MFKSRQVCSRSAPLSGLCVRRGAEKCAYAPASIEGCRHIQVETLIVFLIILSLHTIQFILELEFNSEVFRVSNEIIKLHILVCVHVVHTVIQ